ncbi:MAG: CBS domain-containing protein [Actinobacteria bacterium]|nr:CBS domain-containing protein [Actinomycetota bacterium]MBL7123344.1 CBS domain-containing protein [Actinomycetota bacterium]
MNREITKVQELAYELTVEQAMTRDIVQVHPKNRMGELREILRVNRISGAPVVDKDKLVGIVSIEDFIKCLSDGEIDSLVEDKMTRKVKTLNADEPLIHAVNKFNRHGFGRFPVIERSSGKLVGVIAKGDIIKTLLKELEINYHEEEIHRYRASHIFSDIIADKTTLIFEYNIAGQDFKHAGESASSLKKSLARLGITPQILRRIAIATYEAEMNIVIFTSGGYITAYVKPNKIRVEAVDSGPGIPDVKKAMKPGFSTAPTSVQELGFGAGMGLPNIKKCADKMNINSVVGKGTKLEVIIYTGGGNETLPDS